MADVPVAVDGTFYGSDRWATRPERPADAQAVRAVNLEAFPTAEEADLVDALRDDPAWIDGLSWVATTPTGEVIGHALLTRCTVSGVDALCLAPCAVDPRFQRKGVGTAVIEAALVSARDRGESFVVVLGHPDYYPRFGFRRADAWGVRLAIDVPAEALMLLPLREEVDIPSGTVCYARPFGLPC